ncbi:MAG: hypothetical protein AAB263_11715 [Planctomycetota bacterium]
MASLLIDPLALRMWRLAEAAPAALSQVHVVRERDVLQFGKSDSVCMAENHKIFAMIPAQPSERLLSAVIATVAPSIVLGVWLMETHPSLRETQ